jgi:hypothetical protein
MNAPGRPIERGLHFVTATQTYDGDLNVEFAEGKAAVITAIVMPSPDSSSRHLEFIWNADGSFCSDVPGEHKRCNEETNTP